MTARFAAAVDSHAHIFDPAYPFAADSSYTPHPSQRGTAAQFLAVLDAHGIGYGLLVAALPYGTDNRAMLDAIAASDGRLKGIARVDPTLDEKAWQTLADGGVVGLRVNLSTFGLAELRHPEAARLFAFAREAGWFLEVHCKNDDLAGALDALAATGLRVMIDHVGRPDVAMGLDQPGFRALLALGREGDAVVKLSGPFRFSKTGAPYEDADPFMEAAIDAFTLDRCVWGSDWPFVPWNERVDYGPLVTCLNRWLPDPGDRGRVLWDNPKRLFGFI